jgi:tRNA (guanine-N7-)-methyltransferase
LLYQSNLIFKPLPKIRIRQHVNPLARKFQQPVNLPDWHSIYGNFDQPLHLDIGCARGQFVLEMAKINPQFNFLGVEIREALVIESNLEKDSLGLNNLYYLFCNINISLVELLTSLPIKQLEWITIQFPDPWFKKKHNKRRVVTPEFVNILAQYLTPNTKIFIQSDVLEIATEIGDRFNENPHFQRHHPQPWLENNPFPIATEREIATQNKNEPVYRALYHFDL